MVPEVGLEPTLAEANTALNRARLPIPPLPHFSLEPLTGVEPVTLSLPRIRSTN